MTERKGSAPSQVAGGNDVENDRTVDCPSAKKHAHDNCRLVGDLVS
jgi:hypothetical protein